MSEPQPIIFIGLTCSFDVNAKWRPAGGSGYQTNVMLCLILHFVYTTES